MPIELLILDLDETLIHATNEHLGRKPCFEVDNYFVYKRPGVESFLERLLAQFPVAIWTSATALYAQEVLEKLLPDVESLAFVWSRSQCNEQPGVNAVERLFIKDVEKVKTLGYDPQHVLMVDDKPELYTGSRVNVIPVSPFYGNIEDRELAALRRYLRLIGDVENIGAIDKRHWCNHI